MICQNNSVRKRKTYWRKHCCSVFSERVIRLQFSQIERMYYTRVWNECRDEFKREFQRLWQKRERERNG